MRLYCFHTAAYQELVDQWFGPSAASEYEVVTRCDPDAQVVEYLDDGWLSITRRKVEFILEAVKQSWGEPFVFSDADVQFLGPTRARLSRSLGQRDLLFQKDSLGPHCIGTGFFVCRGNSRTLRLWEAVGERMERAEDCGDGDQDCVRALLVEPLVGRLQHRIRNHDRRNLTATLLSQHRLNRYGIRWNYLATAFFGGGTLTGDRWQPGMTLPIPDPVLVHHANWTTGVTHKVAQLRYVKEVVDLRGT